MPNKKVEQKIANALGISSRNVCSHQAKECEYKVSGFKPKEVDKLWAKINEIAEKHGLMKFAGADLFDKKHRLVLRNITEYGINKKLDVLKEAIDQIRPKKEEKKDKKDDKKDKEGAHANRYKKSKEKIKKIIGRGGRDE